MSLFPPHARGRDQCRLRTVGLAAAQRYLFRLARTISLAFGRTAFSKVPLWIGTETFWVVNVPFGQILRTSHQGDWTVAAKYEGNPNDLKIRNDGLSISPTTRTVS